jgi:hypothetical protein
VSLFPAGHILTSADLDTLFPVAVGAWPAYVPVWTQSTTITKTTNYAQVFKIGRLVIANVSLTATGVGTAANRLSVTLPYTAANGTVRTIGSFRFNKAGTGYYAGSAMILDTTHIIFMQGGPACTEWMGATGSANATAIAANDSLDFIVMYESAT